MKKFAGIIVAVIVAFALGSVVAPGQAQAPSPQAPATEQAKPEQPPVVPETTKLTIQNLSLQFESAQKTQQLVQLQLAQIFQSLQREGWDFNPNTLEYTKKAPVKGGGGQ
jgi:cell division protein FtsN